MITLINWSVEFKEANFKSMLQIEALLCLPFLTNTTEAPWMKKRAQNLNSNSTFQS